MREIVKKITVMVLILTFVFTAVPASHVEAAKKPEKPRYMQRWESVH